MSRPEISTFHRIINLIPRKIRYWAFYSLSYNLDYVFFPIPNTNGFLIGAIEKLNNKKCIFVHVPKTAGLSVGESLFNYEIGHTTIKEYQQIFPSTNFKYYFKFAFVRNPWSRLFSAYCFLEQGGHNERDKKHWKEDLAHYNNFEEFVNNWLNKKNIYQYDHFIPQYKFLCLPQHEELAIDFLGYFESLDADFKHIKAKLSLPKDLTIEHKNSSQHPDYKSVYTKKMRDIVHRVYQTDIELFGYNFDNTNLKRHEKNIY